MHFDQWWNSQAADAFRGLHPDMDGEHFRPVWDAALSSATQQAERKLVSLEPTQAMAKAAADAWLDCGSKLILNKALAAVRAAIQRA